MAVFEAIGAGGRVRRTRKLVLDLFLAGRGAQDHDLIVALPR